MRLILSRKWFGLAALLLWALTGCARTVVTTEIAKDGSWKRSVKLYAFMPSKEGDKENAGLGGSLDSTFVLPKGPEWKTKRGPDKDAAGKEQPNNPLTGLGGMEVYTAERSLTVGQTIEHDVALKSDKMKEPPLVNTVSVRQIAPGRYEYLETIHWQGPPQDLNSGKDFQILNGQSRVEFKKMLPPELATPEKMKALDNGLTKGMWQLTFGPGDPLVASFFEILMFPDAAARKMTGRMAKIFDAALTETFGNDLTPERRLEITRTMAREQFDFFKSMANEKAAAGPPGLGNLDNKDKKKDDPFSSFGGGLVSMVHSVQLPGKIVETNGEVDPILNEVYWTFYSPAAMAGDLHLRAVCDVNP